MIDLPYITFDQLLEWEPCWLTQPGGLDRLQQYVDQLGGRANALDILRISDIPPDDRLWVVLREEMIPATILHETGCWCADQALSLVDNPDPRSVNVVAVKRRWIRGEATDDELHAAKDAALAALDAARTAAFAACTAAGDAARIAELAAARTAELAAARAARRAARGTAQTAAFAASREVQIQHLIGMLEEA